MVIDRDGLPGGAGSVTTYDTEGILVREVRSAASGLVTTSDHSGGKLVGRSFSDDGDAFVWSTHALTYDAAGARLSALTIHDDGTSGLTEFADGIRSRQVCDRDESNGGIDSERFFRADGTLERVERTNAQGVEVATSYAEGRATIRTALDVADAFEFKTHTQSYQSGRVSATTTEFDSGLVRSVTFEGGVMTARVFFDGGDDFGWQSRQMTYDSKGAVTGSHTVWDDLTVTDTSNLL